MNSDLFFGLKKNKKEDKGQFLKSQKEAREQREQAKKEQRCAIKIQALYRSAKIREKVLKELVADRFKKLNDVQKLKDKLPPQQYSLVANKMFQYKGFLSFVVFLKPSNAKDYKDLVSVLSDFLVCSLDADDAVFLNILNKNRETRVAWYVKLKHILNSALQVGFGTTNGEIDGMNDGSQERSIAEKLLNKVMKITPKVWPKLDSVLAKNKDLDISLRKEIKEKLTNSISSSVIQNIIVSQEFKQSAFLRRFILKTAVERQDISNEGMFMELMGLQSFYDDVKAMSAEKRLKLVDFLVRQIEKEQNNKLRDPKFIERFLKELVEFLHFTVTNQLLQGLDAKFFHNIFNIMSTYIESYNSAMLLMVENQKIIANSMEVEEEKGSPTKSPGKQKKQ